jgi:divalent metal cation (Fe/Co/Zn/Cd) transporter
VADSKETLACFFLSIALFIGLGLNYVAGLWQADPVAGFIICAYLIKEGRETLEEEDENGE